MKGRVVGGNGAAPTDLLVCFPSRAHLTLMPKPICSPSRPTDPGKRHPSRPINRGQASPLFRTKTKHTNSEIDEPTSPKVTCAGQIKVRPKSNSSSRPLPSSSSSSSGGKNWLSVVEEIERLHKERKKPTWLEALGIKKDAMQFLSALRSLRFDMRCFGSFHGSPDCTSDEEDDKEDVEEEDEEDKEIESGGSNTIFSKWLMVLEDNQGVGFNKDIEEEEEEEEEQEERDECLRPPSSVPPPNALLLMRCRSAPAKGWLKGDGGEQGGEGEELSATMLKELDDKEKERLVLMSYAPDFFKVSMDIAKETWVVGSMDPLVRCRSWKR